MQAAISLHSGSRKGWVGEAAQVDDLRVHLSKWRLAAAVAHGSWER
jgi:hypothetical protein